MSSLHIWFSKLKWSLDVLLRFYERHAFICALHKVTSNISNAVKLILPYNLDSYFVSPSRKQSCCLTS